MHHGPAQNDTPLPISGGSSVHSSEKRSVSAVTTPSHPWPEKSELDLSLIHQIAQIGLDDRVGELVLRGLGQDSVNGLAHLGYHFGGLCGAAGGLQHSLQPSL